MTEEEKKIRTRNLNDELRTTGRSINGHSILTGDLARERPDRERLTPIIQALRTFDDWPEDNDPYHEHDFGTFTVEGESKPFMFKIDYYALDEESGSNHPEDPAVTIRVLSLFYASDY